MVNALITQEAWGALRVHGHAQMSAGTLGEVGIAAGAGAWPIDDHGVPGVDVCERVFGLFGIVSPVCVSPVYFWGSFLGRVLMWAVAVFTCRGFGGGGGGLAGGLGLAWVLVSYFGGFVHSLSCLVAYGLGLTTHLLCQFDRILHNCIDLCDHSIDQVKAVLKHIAYQVGHR